MADEVVRLIRVLDGFNRVRFGNDANLLAGWIAATNIIGPPVAERRGDSRTVTAPDRQVRRPAKIKPAA